MKKLVAKAATTLLLVAGGGAAFVYSGAFNFAADEPHSPLVFKVIETLRERSIAVRLDDIEVPKLDDPALLLAGGPDYQDMCAGCHLQPGQADSDLRIGLYPQPPKLVATAEEHGHDHEHGHSDATHSAARQFWIIKHGIKGSGMAAFGKTHDDARIWAMVAFLQKLPSLDATQYQILTARASGEATAPASAGHSGHSAATAPETAEATLDAFQAALQSGNVDVAKRLLLPDVLIYESGGVESSRDEYASHHLSADIAFLRQATVERLARASDEKDDSAWVTTDSRIRGTTAKGQPLDLSSKETALLKRTPEGWRISHLHWSSREASNAH